MIEVKLTKKEGRALIKLIKKDFTSKVLLEVLYKVESRMVWPYSNLIRRLKN